MGQGRDHYPIFLMPPNFGNRLISDWCSSMIAQPTSHASKCLSCLTSYIFTIAWWIHSYSAYNVSWKTESSKKQSVRSSPSHLFLYLRLLLQRPEFVPMPFHSICQCPILLQPIWTKFMAFEDSVCEQLPKRAHIHMHSLRFPWKLRFWASGTKSRAPWFQYI